MKPGHLLAIARSALCVCVFACAALVVDYQNPGDPAFCAVESSCFRVRTSEVGDLLAERLHAMVPGLLLPQLALFIFLGMLAFTFFVKSRLHLNVFALLNGVGAAFAGYLIVAQVKMKLFCAYCMVVDLAMLVAAAAAIALAVVVGRRARKDPGAADEELARSIERATDTRATIGWGIAGALLTAIPFLWARYPVNPPLPPQLAELQQPGKAVVVMFTDFQCPFCRKLHAETKAALHAPSVLLHRKMVPLPGHTGALPAALGYTCAPAERQNDVADALYSMDPAELTYEGVTRMLTELEIADEASVVRCIRDPETLARVEAEKKLFFEELGGSGLPTTYAGGTMIKGAQSDKVIRSIGRSGSVELQLPVWSMFVLSGLVLLGVLIATERQRRAPASPPSEPPAPTKDADEESA